MRSSYGWYLVVLTLIAYILFVLATILVSLYPTIIVAKAYLKKSLSSVAFRELVANSRLLTIIIPSKGEAVPLVIKNLAKLSSMQCIDEVLLVLDDPLDYVEALVKDIDEEFFSKGVVVSRINSFGGRNSALTDGARLSLSQNILVIDVDTVPSQELLCDAKRCRDVCVGIWRPYVEVGTRVEEAMAFSTGFGSWVYYELKSKLNLFVYPLGAGTVINRKLIEDVGFWRTDVIQDDIWLGYELMFRGFKPRVLKGYIEVGVPKTLSAAKIQQCRWSYGAVNVLSRFWSRVVRSPLKFFEKLDAIIYTLQPTVSIVALISFILALISSLIDRYVDFKFIYVIPITLALTFQGTAMGFYGRKILGLNKWKVLYLSGRTGALYTVLSPLLGFYALKGLLRMRYRYIVTPKVFQKRRTIDLSEALCLTLSIPTLIASIITKNSLSLLIALILFIATIYSIVRLEK
jgi:cellulose synthase/poly-beta-1,6-N-acetylglucosamine synthase-like glycosyltransferase